MMATSADGDKEKLKASFNVVKEIDKFRETEGRRIYNTAPSLLTNLLYASIPLFAHTDNG